MSGIVLDPITCNRPLSHHLYTPYTLRRLNLNKGSVISASCLTDRDPAAHKDFFGMPSGAPCVYKSGPETERQGLETRSIIRELVYDYPLQNSVGVGDASNKPAAPTAPSSELFRVRRHNGIAPPIGGGMSPLKDAYVVVGGPGRPEHLWLNVGTDSSFTLAASCRPAPSPEEAILPYLDRCEAQDSPLRRCGGCR